MRSKEMLQKKTCPLVAKEENNPVSIDEPYKTIVIEDGLSKSNWPLETNEIRTTHYTLLTFLPLCLFQQAMRPANFYFIIVACIQLPKEFSTSQGVPTMCLPLSFVIGFSMIKYAIEDYKRYVDDCKQNSKVYTRIRMKTLGDEGEDILPGEGSTECIRNSDIQVGDIIVVKDGEEMPADMLLLGRHKKRDELSPKMFCHVATANIDGETSLKVKTVPEGLNKIESEIYKSITDRSSNMRWRVKSRHSKPSVYGGIEDEKRRCQTIFNNVSMKVSIANPTGCLDEFKGASITINRGKVDEKYPLDIDNFLHRGCNLANSGYIYGLVLYVGEECKIFKNASDTKNISLKKSQVEDVMNSMIFLMGCVMLFVCTVLAINTGTWADNNGQDAWYIHFIRDPAKEGSFRFFTWMIIFCQFVPISMVVSVEMMRLCQSILMALDEKLIRRVTVGQKPKVIRCKAQQSSLNEDLGLVEFVFSDKTGTLTENVLTFRQAFIPGIGRVGGGCTQIALMSALKEEIDVTKFDNYSKVKSHQNIRSLSRRSMQNMMSHVMLTGHVNEREAWSALQDADFDREDAAENLKSRWEHANYVCMTKDTRVQIRNSLERSIERNYLHNLEPFEISSPPSVEDCPDLYTEIFLRSLIMNNDVFPVLNDEQEIEYNASTPDDICMVSFTKFVGMSLIPYIKPDRNIEMDIRDENWVEKWQELYLLKFSSAKARMSIVCRRRTYKEETPDDRIFVFVKGSDKAVSALADPKSLEYYKKQMESTVDDFSNEGLRTLLVGYAVHTPEWWEKWEKKFEQQKTDEAREALEEKFDRAAGYHICGVTAVEDQLQDQVPETIESLIEAGIRVWMLTGDKRETAINIGVACNLLTKDTTNRVLISKDNALQVLRDFDPNKASKLQLVIDGGALTKIFDAHEHYSMKSEDSGVPMDPKDDYLTKFIELALCAQSVVSCRLMPNQKALIIQCIKMKTGLVTLAIGDGANDVPMIKTAGIGVGIQGLEGTAAARNSDYVISRFHHLSRLLFYHGRMAYRGTCFMILYLIWKNSQLGFVFVWFSFFSGFSGQNPMNEYLYQVYNTFPTGFPIFAYVLFDTDILPAFLQQYTHLYSITNGSKFKSKDLESLEHERKRRSRKVHFEGGGAFNFRSVVAMVCESIIISLCISIPILVSFSESTSWTIEGHSWGIMICGSIFWLSLVWVANLRLFVEFFCWTRWHYLSFAISLSSVPVLFAVLNSSSYFSLSGIDYYTLVSYFLGSTAWWLLLALGFLVPLVPIFMIKITRWLFFPGDLFPYQYETQIIRQTEPTCANF